MDYKLGADLSKDRIATIQLTNLTLRCMENWSHHAGGYDEAMILVAVVAITLEKYTRSPLPPGFENLSRPLLVGHVQPCSVSSIAAATGLNRETARRKIAALVERGMLVRIDDTGVLFSKGMLQKKGTRDLIRSQVEAFRRTAEVLLNEGVLTIAAVKPSP